jgi:hypothetical protein
LRIEISSVGSDFAAGEASGLALEQVIEAASIKIDAQYSAMRIPPLKKGGRGDLLLLMN